MTDPVRAYAPTFADKFEGKVPWMYLDVKGLVTVARGNLVDPVQYALPLTFMTQDGREADVNEVLSQWNTIKAAKHLAKVGHRGVWLVVEKAGQQVLKMSDAEMDRLFFQKFDQNETHLRFRFPDMPSWPQDARLFVHSMAWACGPSFRFPLLEAFLRAKQFQNCIKEANINSVGNLGVEPRNVANRILLQNAAVVVMSGIDTDVLHYPKALKFPPSEAQALPVGDVPSEPAGENPNSELVQGSGPTIHIVNYPLT